MSHLVPALLVLLFSAVSVSAQTSLPNPPKPKAEECSVSGMVVRLAGGEPLKGASVQLQNLENRPQTSSTVTDAGGRFEMKGIAPAAIGSASRAMALSRSSTGSASQRIQEQSSVFGPVKT